MFRTALLVAVTLASVAPAFAAPVTVPALGSPLPVAVAIGAVAVALRLFRRS